MVNGFKVKTSYRALRFFLYCYLPFAICHLLTGCATTPSSRSEFPVQYSYVNGIIYYPLSNVCQYLGISWDYDSFGRQVTLKKTGVEAKLLVDSSVVLVNGLPQNLQQPVIMNNGVISVPQKFKESILDKYYRLISPKKEVQCLALGEIKKIVIDAGHGGHDPGAIGRSGIKEKDVNLDIARRLGKLLELQGINVVFTRKTDTFISLEDRTRIANKAHPDLFISIHSNSARSHQLSGFEVFYISEDADDISRALTAARDYDLGFDRSAFASNSLNLKAVLWDMVNMQNRADSIVLAQNICQAVNHNLGSKILGVKGARFYVLKSAWIPAVLIEVGFLSNTQEERYLRNGFYRQQIAEAIFDGISDYSKECDLKEVVLAKN